MITIRKASENDVDNIVSIHQQAFVDFFLTSLGKRFLRLYYRCMCRCEEAITLCAVENDEIKGFVTCSYYSRGFNRNLIKNNCFRFVGVTIGLMLTKPKAFFRLVQNMEKKTGECDVEDAGEYAELYSIAVMPEYQNQGIGKALLTKAEECLAKHNTKLSLTTDYYNNEKTICFYQSLGYQVFYEFWTYPKRRMFRMIKTFNV